MRDGWRALRLGDAVEIKHGYAFPGTGFSSDPSYPTVVTPGNFRIGGGFQEAKVKTFTGDVPDGFVLQAGELIVTMTDLSKTGDTLGYPAFVPGDRTYLHNQRIGKVILLDTELVDLQYVALVMQASSYRSHVLGTASGSTVRHTSPGRILDFKTAFPPIEEQRRIAGVLRALDDLVDTDHALCQQAGSLAATLAATSPERVPLVDLASVADVRQFRPAGLVDHYSIPAFDDALLPERTDGEAIKSGKLRLAEPTVLVSRLNPQTPRVWMAYPSDVPAAASTEFVPLVAGESVAVEEVWAACAANEFAAQMRARVTGTTGSHQRVDKAAIAQLLVADVRQLDSEKQAAITSLVREAYASLLDASEAARVRDQLLPLLLTGRVKVEEVAA